MRKDFIMSGEQLQLRKERLQQIRNISSTSDVLSESLNEIDQVNRSIHFQMISTNEISMYLVNDECESR